MHNHAILVVDTGAGIERYHWSIRQGVFESGAHFYADTVCQPEVDFIEKLPKL